MLTRRRFVQGVGGGAILSASGLPLFDSTPAGEDTDENTWLAGIRAWF
jgi:hypothetical protein